jgi:hypothetical protein
MVLRIQLRDNSYDYVNHQTLDVLINKRSIKQFYRPIAKTWVNIDIDPIRRSGSGSYTGIERRQ